MSGLATVGQSTHTEVMHNNRFSEIGSGQAFSIKMCPKEYLYFVVFFYYYYFLCYFFTGILQHSVPAFLYVMDL